VNVQKNSYIQTGYDIQKTIRIRVFSVFPLPAWISLYWKKNWDIIRIFDTIYVEV